MAWKINGTITGHYGCPIKVAAHALLTGELMASTIVESGATSYEIDMPNEDECYVTYVPDVGSRWRAGTFYSLDDRVYPGDPSTMPYYYRCTNPGHSGKVEPNFIADELIRIPDGNCVWERVERIPPPILQYPFKANFIEG